MGNDEEKGLKEGIGWSEERCWEKWRRSLAFGEENTTFKEEVQISHDTLCCAKISHSYGVPRQRAWFWKFVPKTNSHKVCTRFAFLWNSHKGFWEGTESMHFLKIGTKAFSHKGCVVRKFRTTGSVVRKWLSLGFFLPCFPLFSPWLHSLSFPTCMLT